MMNNISMYRLTCLCILPLLFVVKGVLAIPKITKFIPDNLFGILQLKKKQYTPLLFFTVPKGLLPECDAMEKVVSDVEKELNVRIERMDVLRQPTNEMLLQLITNKNPPFLYHRESCQSYSITTTSAPTKAGSGGASGNESMPKRTSPVYIDKGKVRAWAKGRYLKAYQTSTAILSRGSNINNDETVDAPTVINQPMLVEEQQQDMLEDMVLTPEQRKGKKLIKERTEALREEAIRKREQQQKQEATKALL